MHPLRGFLIVGLFGCAPADLESPGASGAQDAVDLLDAAAARGLFDPQDASEAGPPDSGESARLERVSVVDHDLWRRVELAEDPFQDGGVAVSCERPSYFSTVFVGEFAFEVETGSCNYLTFVQPARQKVRAGELVKGRLWHFELFASAAAEAHVAIRIGDLAWETTHAIPSGSGLDAPKWRAEHDIEQGTPIYFHVDNHGANDWVLIELSTGP